MYISTEVIKYAVGIIASVFAWVWSRSIRTLDKYDERITNCENRLTIIETQIEVEKSFEETAAT